jgi:prolipoprotein diacylglyceryltransferase
MWQDRKARGIGLVVVTGLIVTFVRQGISHHWHGFASWESFFSSWFIHTIGVSVFSAFAAAAIMGTHKFFRGDEWKDDMEELMFHVVMTVLVGAFAIAVVANAPEVEDDARLLFSLFG